LATAVGKPESLAPETERKLNFEIAKIWVRVNLLAPLPKKIISGFSNGRECSRFVNGRQSSAKSTRSRSRESCGTRRSRPGRSAADRRNLKVPQEVDILQTTPPETLKGSVHPQEGEPRMLEVDRTPVSEPETVSERINGGVPASVASTIAATKAGPSTVIVLHKDLAPHATQAEKRSLLPGLQPEEWPQGHDRLENFIIFFAWNIRGLNSITRHTMVKEWISSHRPLFGAFLETHVQPSNSSRISRAIPSGWSFFANFDHHETARIVVVWDPSVTMTIYQVSAQAITCGIFILSQNITLTVTFVYGFNLANERRALWDELSVLNASTPVSRAPWAVLGDFNQILRANQHSNHLDLEVDSAGMEEFNLATQEAEVFEAQAKGLPFSWWNNQEGNPIAKKIDHALINQQWAMLFPDAYSEFMEPHQSDHAPCLFRMSGFHQRISKPFKFFHHIIDHPLYTKTVREAWRCDVIQGSAQFKLMRSLKLLKMDLRGLNKRYYSGISARVKDQAAKISGLEMNPAKSEIFFGGYNDSEARVLSGISGIKIGAFPTRYLGLPLNPAKISMATLQPFLERITSKLHSWTVKLLSFAGKIRLIASVIYEMVNFWSSVFVLPKSFYAKVDSLCAAFLWRNKTGSAAGARVAWRDVCKLTEEGGIGIRLLEDFQLVFRLNQVWNFFTNAGSLWVAWLRNHVFRRKSFWATEDSSRLSKAVRSMLQLKPHLLDFMRCDLNNGELASFWFDCWTDLGPLISVTGESGPRNLKVRRDARVIEATRHGDWIFPPARSTQMENLQIALSAIPPPQVALGQHIPRSSFVAWLALLRRLPTRDRLRRWGMSVPLDCVLCSSGVETHHHLFFECGFSTSIWCFFSSKIWVNPPLDLHSAAAWIMQARPQTRSNPQALAIIKLIFQSCIYLVWKERNARIFTSSSSTPESSRAVLDRMMRDRLLSLTPCSPSSPSLLEFYFACTRPP
ncbi:unnamed protein product, partial [Thlaspi arvense]